jgi:integrase
VPEPIAPELAAAVLTTAPAFSQSPAAVYLLRLAPGSRPSMASALARLAGLLAGHPTDVQLFPWPLVRYAHVQALRAALAEVLAPATTNRHLAALRGVLGETWRLGLAPREECLRAADVPGVPVPETGLAGRALAAAELRALFAICDVTTAAGARDAALVALLYGCGLRRSEVVRLQLRDYDPTARAVKVTGKGHRQRLVPVLGGARAAVTAWLAIRGAAAGPLLHPIHRGGAIRRRAMTPHAVFQRLRALGPRAGLAGFSPHDLRRTCITDLFDAGADALAVRDLAGHASLQTTARYDRRGERGKQRAAELLVVPYVKPPASEV